MGGEKLCLWHTADQQGGSGGEWERQRLASKQIVGRQAEEASQEGNKDRGVQEIEMRLPGKEKQHVRLRGALPSPKYPVWSLAGSLHKF